MSERSGPIKMCQEHNLPAGRQSGLTRHPGKGRDATVFHLILHGKACDHDQVLRGTGPEPKRREGVEILTDWDK